MNGWVNPEHPATPLKGIVSALSNASDSGSIQNSSPSHQGPAIRSSSLERRLGAAIIYLDESGDLGWTFSAPYRQGGSSRYLTLASLCIPPEKKHIPKRIISDLYRKFHWSVSKEKKWSDMSQSARTEFAKSAVAMCNAHADICIHAIIVKKENVGEHIRRDPNKLYNYMIRLSLLDRIAAYDEVTMVPDPRSIKVESGNSLHDYLQTELWFTKSVKTKLLTRPVDSKSCRGIQFSDMVAGLVQTRFEDRFFDDIRILVPKLRLNRLFFGS